MEQREEHVSSLEHLADAEGSGTLSVLAKAEISQQISTAKAYPRSITEFMREAEKLVTINEEMARACVYALPRGGKVIEGPSARFAEIMAYSFRNMRYGARPVVEEEEFITSQGVAYDLERNNGITIEVRRRISDKDGRRFNADMIGVTANAANAIALRNAVLKIIPKAIWNPIYQKARQTIMGEFETFNNRLGKMFEEFQRYGVTKDMICVKMEKKGVADIKIDDMVVLAGMLTALQEGDSTPEQMFQTEAGGGIRQPEQRQPTPDLSPAEVERRKAEAAALAKKAEDERKAAEKKPEKKNDGPNKEEPKGDATGEKITPNMVKQITLRCDAYSVDLAKLLGHFGISKTNDLPLSKAQEALDWIEKNGQA